MRELEYPFDGKKIVTQKLKLKRMLLKDGTKRVQKKIAILGGSTTNDIKNCMELFLLNYGFEPVFYESEYNQYYENAMFPPKELLDFSPDIIYIYTTYRNILDFPSTSDTSQDIEHFLEEEAGRWLAVWQNLRQTFRCPLIQNNFEKPPYRLLGNKDVSDIHGKLNYISRLNQKFYEYSQNNEDFYVCDIDYISSDYGLSQWHDLQNWYLYKYAMSLAAIPSLAFNVANIIKSIFGKNKKGFVLDLDNTLWEGVIGEDGVDNITIGPENAVGQAYLEFQTYLREHKQLGVLLNVDSKNDMENAIAGLNHPDSVLKPEDMIVIKANWEQKDRNFVEIAKDLSLLPEGLVFVDDNPAEREIVRQQLPGVAVPDLGSVEDYIRTIDHSGFFETTILSADDGKRTQMYKQNVKRASLQAKYENYTDYLESLEMEAVIEPFTPVLMARITQLTNKSNQYNLTTRRYTLEEIEQVSRDEDYIDLYARLKDRFGDNGVVSVAIGHQKGNVCEIDLWLMSCRVLKRDLEYALMDEFIRICAARGVTLVRGFYYPTAKNAMVKNFYALQGFHKVKEDADGCVWELEVKDYEPKNKVIAVNTRREQENEQN